MLKFYMPNHKVLLPLLAFLVLTGETIFSQVVTNTNVLRQAAVNQASKEKDLMKQLEQLSREKGWPMTMTGKNGKFSVLSGIDPFGYPLYTTTFNNTISAATIKTSRLWPGGSTGLNLNGAGSNL